MLHRDITSEELYLNLFIDVYQIVVQHFAFTPSDIGDEAPFLAPFL